MNLKPQDIVFLLKLVARGKKPWSFNKIALDLGVSPSEVHAAAQRSVAAELANKLESEIRPNVRNLSEFLEHGIQYVFVPERGAIERGMPTSFAASPLKEAFAGEFEVPPVWPDPEGKVRGESFSPLYKSVPDAAKKDSQLYELLALVDAIRGGRARDKKLANKELAQRLNRDGMEADVVKRSDENTIVIASEIVISKQVLQASAKKFHIKRLSLFGSAARGELKSSSDIDLLVEFEKGNTPSMGGMVEVHDALESLFNGYKVDLATPSTLNNPYRRKEIEKDLEQLYAA